MSRALGFVLFLAAAPASAAGLAYVRASSQLDPKDHGHYHPINLLDEDPSTTWCEGAEGLGEDENVVIYFKKRQRINRIVVNPATSSGRKIQRLRISDGSNKINIDVGDEGIDQNLSHPLEGQTFEITIAKVAGPNSGALPPDVACIADVVLYQGNQPFGGKPNEKIRYDERLDKLLGRWQGGPLGAPEKFIVFSLDGTWEWNFSPLIGGRGRRLSGEYRFRGKRLLMREGEVGRWSDIQLKVERIKVDPDEVGAPSEDYDRMTLQGPLTEAVVGEYNNAKFD
jgi:hypothetical protein